MSSWLQLLLIKIHWFLSLWFRSFRKFWGEGGGGGWRRVPGALQKLVLELQKTYNRKLQGGGEV